MNSPKGFLTHEEVDAFYALAGEAKAIYHDAGNMVDDLKQSVEDDVNMVFDGFTEGLANVFG